MRGLSDLEIPRIVSNRVRREAKRVKTTALGHESRMICTIFSPNHAVATVGISWFWCIGG